MNHLRSTQTGENYLLLGNAFKTGDLWLARHQASQRLVLVQRFFHPNPSLRHMLAFKHECLPRVLDHWVSDGSIYTVLERVDGPSIEQLGSGRLSASTKARLRSMLDALSQLGWRCDSTSSVCVDAKGSLRLRCFPRPSMKAA